MKNIKFVFVFLLGLLINTCSLINLDDECGKSELLYFQSFNLKVSTIFHQNVKPLPDLKVKIESYKTACGIEGVKPGSLFTFTGVTDSRGNFDGEMVGYQLRYEQDAIIINIYYLKEDGSWFLVDHQEYNSEFFKSPIDPRVLQYYYNI